MTHHATERSSDMKTGPPIIRSAALRIEEVDGGRGSGRLALSPSRSVAPSAFGAAYHQICLLESLPRESTP